MSFRNGTGTTVTFAEIVGELLDVSGPEGKRDIIEVTHMGSTVAKEFIAGSLIDWGEVKLTIAFDGEIPVMSNTVSACTILWGLAEDPDTRETWSFDAVMVGFAPKAPLEDKMTADVTLKVAGVIT
jgi:hypothetical protein